MSEGEDLEWRGGQTQPYTALVAEVTVADITCQTRVLLKFLFRLP